MSITGGYLKEIPEPHRRRWPNNHELRPVSVRIGQFIGYPHWHVNVREEDNPIWDSRDAAGWGRPRQERGWTNCWDDIDGRGKVFSDIFSSQTEAMHFVEQLILEHFRPETHRVSINLEEAEFYYKRDGA